MYYQGRIEERHKLVQSTLESVDFSYCLRLVFVSVAGLEALGRVEWAHVLNDTLCAFVQLLTPL
jgi:hypothetical protein